MGIISLKFCQVDGCKEAGFERHHYLGAIPLVIDLCHECEKLANKRRPAKKFQPNPFKAEEEVPEKA